MKRIGSISCVLATLLCFGCAEERKGAAFTDPLRAALEVHLETFPESRGKYFSVEWKVSPSYSDSTLAFEQLDLEVITAEAAKSLTEEYILVKVEHEEDGYWKRLVFDFVGSEFEDLEQSVRLEREGGKWWAEEDSILIWQSNCQF